ncbi:hypothetical protein GNQ68_02905 [Pseudomonas aeruginosa]|nr:hypothetical protein [Pseudomonas aeruginosa]
MTTLSEPPSRPSGQPSPLRLRHLRPPLDAESLASSPSVTAGCRSRAVQRRASATASRTGR